MTATVLKQNENTVKHPQIAPLYKNKLFGVCLLILGVFSVLVIVH